MGMDIDRDILGRVGRGIVDIDNMEKLGSNNVSTSMKEYSFGFGLVRSRARFVCFDGVEMMRARLRFMLL
jgi:hypothetical protein